ncbi:MAG: hypothetical protein ACRDJN_27220 [Chloroflexota bacterium]
MMVGSEAPERRPSRGRVEAVAEQLAAELRREFPQVTASDVTFDTREGEDAYLWLTIPAEDAELRRRLLSVAAAKTAAYLGEGIAILPQFRLANAGT